MKKITILSLHLGYGGIERCVATLANMLVDLYDIEIVSTYKLYEEPAFYIDKRVKIKYLTDKKPNKNEFYDKLKSKKIIGTVKEGVKALKILSDKKSTMINYIKNCDSDVIISTREIFNDYVGIYANENILKIGWEHNHYHDNMKYAENVVRKSSKLDYLVLVSNSLNAFYKGRLRNSKCKTVYIPNVIDYIPKDSDISDLKSKRLISVGRLSKEKGYMDLLKMFKEINKNYPDWCLDIIGDGNEKDALEKYIENNHLEDKVVLHGFKNREYIYEKFKSSSIYLMTSHTESFGIVLLEGMSMGLPCISFSSAEGANEIINSGSNGYLIKNRNFDAFIKKAEDLMENYEERLKIGAKGRRTVKNYSSEVVSKMWIDLIEKK